MYMYMCITFLTVMCMYMDADVCAHTSNIRTVRALQHTHTCTYDCQKCLHTCTCAMCSINRLLSNIVREHNIAELYTLIILVLYYPLKFHVHIDS